VRAKGGAVTDADAGKPGVVRGGARWAKRCVATADAVDAPPGVPPADGGVAIAAAVSPQRGPQRGVRKGRLAASPRAAAAVKLRQWLHRRPRASLPPPPMRSPPRPLAVAPPRLRRLPVAAVAEAAVAYSAPPHTVLALAVGADLCAAWSNAHPQGGSLVATCATASTAAAADARKCGIVGEFGARTVANAPAGQPMAQLSAHAVAIAVASDDTVPDVDGATNVGSSEALNRRQNGLRGWRLPPSPPPPPPPTNEIPAAHLRRNRHRGRCASPSHPERAGKC